MADGSAFNVREILKQLGIKDVSELPILKSIQPSLPLGDASAIASPLLPPTALVGGYSVGNGSTTNGCVAILAAPGGSYLRSFSVNTSANGTISFSVVPKGTYTYASSTAVTNFLMSSEAAQTVAMNTTILSGGIVSATLAPRRYITTSGFGFEDLIYIPPGYVFESHMRSNSIASYWSAVVQDVVAPNLTPGG
jgi:hypothetical protein